MSVKPRGKIYSVNEGYEAQWDDVVKEYVANKKRPKVRTREALLCDAFFVSLDAIMMTA